MLGMISIFHFVVIRAELCCATFIVSNCIFNIIPTFSNKILVNFIIFQHNKNKKCVKITATDTNV